MNSLDSNPLNNTTFEFILYEIEPEVVSQASVVKEVKLHRHKKRSNFDLDFPTFENTPNLDLTFSLSTSTSNTTNSDNSNSTSTSNSNSTPSSTLISRVNSQDAESISSIIGSSSMSPSTSNDGGRGRATSISSGSSTSHRRTKSPSSPINDTLVADMRISKNRMVISKKYTAYDHPAVPYPKSCIVGFNVAFHNPPSARSRVKDAEFHIYFYPLASNSDSPSPIIRAISPDASQSNIGATTSTEHKKSNTAGFALSYNPGGTLSFSRTHETSWTELSSAKLLVSGIETNHAMITLGEDTRIESGIPSSFNFAILVELPPIQVQNTFDTDQQSFSPSSPPLLPTSSSNQDLSKGFEIDFSVETSIGLSSGIRRFKNNPKEWVIRYDGYTEMGKIEMGNLEADGSIVKKD